MGKTASNTRMTREESQQQTRARLIEAAQMLIARNGIAGASVRDIAAAAGYSQGAFYSNFGSKEDLLLALLRRHMEAEADQLAALLEEDDRNVPPQPLGERIERWMATLNRDADWSMLAIELQLVANRNPAFALRNHAAWTNQRQRLGAVLTQIFAREDAVLPLDAEHIAAGFMALAQGLALQRPEQRPDPAGPLIAMFLRSLLQAGRMARLADPAPRDV